jgi:hypothetical protein
VPFLNRDAQKPLPGAPRQEASAVRKAAGLAKKFIEINLDTNSTSE